MLHDAPSSLRDPAEYAIPDPSSVLKVSKLCASLATSSSGVILARKTPSVVWQA